MMAAHGRCHRSEPLPQGEGKSGAGQACGESRVRHGRSKRERDAQQREQRQADALAGKRLEPEEPIDN